MQSCVKKKKVMAPFFFYDPEFIFSLCGGGDGRVRLIVYLREEEGQGWGDAP